MSSIGYFGRIVAKGSKYNKELVVNRNYADAFKAARMALKSMIEITLVDSNSEDGSFVLESEFAHIKILLEKIDDEQSKFSITSTPYYYQNVRDFDKYTRDVKNIITTLKLNLNPQKYDQEDINDEPLKESELKQEFKPFLILYFRLIKMWTLSILTAITVIIAYYISLSAITRFSTVFFFLIIFLYILHLFTTEIETTTSLMICPICKEKMIQKKYNIAEYKVITTCKHCNNLI
jgi:hypothetical protein